MCTNKILAQHREDFVMYAKDSSVEIKQPFIAVPIPDSIGVNADKLSRLTLLLNGHLDKLNSVLAEHELNEKQKKESINKLDVDFLNSIADFLSMEETRRFKRWYQQAFHPSTN